MAELDIEKELPRAYEALIDLGLLRLAAAVSKAIAEREEHIAALDDRERLRAALAAACDDLEAYVHDEYDGTSGLQARLAEVAKHRAALEGRDG